MDKMDKSFTIKVRKESNEMELAPDNITTEEGIALALGALHILIKNACDKHGTSKEIRGNLYDRLVVGLSSIANDIFPEHQELYKKTPEALLAELDKRSAINKQKQS